MTAPDTVRAEFVARSALLISLVALSIDTMLPALPAIAADLGVAGANESQLIISALFAGLALGQLVSGPMSDSIGRKPAMFAGLALFAVGCLVSMYAQSFAWMLAGRVLQGLGVAAPRTVVVALVRDQYAGVQMARVMSFVLTVFIFVPMVAPALGQLVLKFSTWHGIFATFLAIAVIAFAWLALRQPETLPPAQRRPFSLHGVARGALEVCRNRTALYFALAQSMVLAAFLGFLTSAQPILQVQYGLGDQFALYFAVLAASLGCASLSNTRLVVRHGMRKVSGTAIVALIAVSVLMIPFAWASHGQPPLWLLLCWLLPTFFCVGLQFANLNALAMEPLGHLAGIGATVIGSLTTFIAVPLGSAIGLAYNGTIGPMLAGFVVFGTLALWMSKVAVRA